ncbi:unnamed protein product [Rotaria sp. Silwood2]|nr:unnamed protein product [Rotaria sp. Silwood2]CAF4196501.1 unnamed protein product [Rotaria sp. Silwood2]CAF4310513.1 unnamed protein product [Rotaria sp. Silwood2]CAF4412927.1 unnamed protein product [Rotaria sp. Silwood2]CAF4604486.1 unnamed protein product [Rotaria sp. Silwood2]
MSATTRPLRDPKQDQVGLKNMERLEQQRRQKVARSRSDDEDMDTPMNEDQYTYSKTPKTARYNGPHQEKIYKNRNLQRKFNEQEYNDSEQILISDQAIAHSIDTRLPMIRIHCNPSIRSKETDPRHKDPIGLDQWWLQDNGNLFCGVTDDIDFYMYLCDVSHYPSSIGNVQIKLEPPKQLPAQNSVVIKFVPTTISKDDVLDEMKPRFSSIFMVNEMIGTARSSTRQIRVIFKQQNEYAKILYDGRIVIQGLVLDVDEYLPPPKILICTKCNLPGHIKKACQASFAICRRCGQDKENGDSHTECAIRCQHCGGNHISTDYKCPTIVNFRKNLLDKLKNNADKLPAHVRMFIPIDCRKPNDRDRDRILTSSRRGYSAPHPPMTTTSNSSYSPTMNFWTSRQEAANGSLSKEYSAIRAFDNELNKIKKDFDEEKNRINSLYEKQIETVKKGWLILQQQIRAQNECLASMQQVISTTIDCSVNLSTTNNILCEFVKTVCRDEQKEHIESMKNTNGVTTTHLMQLKDSFQR